jgi:hypothetical protein
MSFVASIRQRLAEPERRRTIRMVRPGVQLKLAVYLLAVSFGFALLLGFNSWAAYGRLFHGTLATAPAPFAQDIVEQTTPFLKTTAALLGGYVIAVLGVTIAYLHRVVGPMVAIERHLRALQRGDYASRVSLRSGDHVYGTLADLLNDLAERLESSTRQRPRPR